MDNLKLSRIIHIGREIMVLEVRLREADNRLRTAQAELDRDNLTTREWTNAAHEYGVAHGIRCSVDNRLRIVRGRFHFEVQNV